MLTNTRVVLAEFEVEVGANHSGHRYFFFEDTYIILGFPDGLSRIGLFPLDGPPTGLHLSDNEVAILRN